MEFNAMEFKMEFSDEIAGECLYEEMHTVKTVSYKVITVTRKDGSQEDRIEDVQDHRQRDSSPEWKDLSPQDRAHWMRLAHQRSPASSQRH